MARMRMQRVGTERDGECDCGCGKDGYAWTAGSGEGYVTAASASCAVWLLLDVGLVRCPECGNHDRAKVEDNGLKASHFDYTLLCTACGTQWEPGEGL